MNILIWIGILILPTFFLGRVFIRFLKSAVLIVRWVLGSRHRRATKADLAIFYKGCFIMLEIGFALILSIIYGPDMLMCSIGVGFFVGFGVCIMIDSSLKEYENFGPEIGNMYTVTTYYCPKCERRITGSDIPLGSQVIMCSGCGTYISLIKTIKENSDKKLSADYTYHYHHALPQQEEVSAKDDNPIDLYDCPHCGTKGILPMKENRCPNCKKPL